jgi:hypothetical protein
MKSIRNSLIDMERKELIQSLRECDWMVERAAKRLGITERMLGYKLRKHGIRKGEVLWSGFEKGCAADKGEKTIDEQKTEFVRNSDEEEKCEDLTELWQQRYLELAFWRVTYMRKNRKSRAAYR